MLQIALDDLGMTFFCIVFGVIGLTWVAFHCLQGRSLARLGRPRRPRRPRPRPVAALTDGPATVEGRVVPGPGPLLTSPLSGHAAVGYSVRITSRLQFNDEVRWDESVEACADFHVEDAAGDRLLVRGSNAHISLVGRQIPRTRQDLTGCAPPALRAAFRSSTGSTELLDHALARGGERLLCAGDRVRVFGHLSYQVGVDLPAPGFRSAPGARCLTAPPDDPDTPLVIVPLG